MSNEQMIRIPSSLAESAVDAFAAIGMHDQLDALNEILAKAAEQHQGEPVALKPKFGILAGEPEIIGERCRDGGACHHECTQTCFRRLNCGALTGSGLNPDWSEPK